MSVERRAWSDCVDRVYILRGKDQDDKESYLCASASSALYRTGDHRTGGHRRRVQVSAVMLRAKGLIWESKSIS